VILGSWGFGDATLLSLLCLLAAGYLRLRAVRRFRTAPDGAMLLDRSLQLAASGQTGAAMAVLTEAIRMNPRLWQAFQYRGELHLQGGAAGAALADFDRAIELAPQESHIHLLRGHAARSLAENAAKPS
jgi:tetratricopeptide (TPR) repeat protein